MADPEISRFPYKELPYMPGSQTTQGRLGTRADVPGRAQPSEFMPAGAASLRLVHPCCLNRVHLLSHSRLVGAELCPGYP